MATKDEEEKKNQQSVPQNGTPDSHYVKELTPIEDEINEDETTVVTPTPTTPTTTTTDTYLKRRQEISDKYAKQAAGYDKILADIQAELDQQKGKRRKEERLQALQATLDGITDFARVMNDIDTANHYVPYTAPKTTLSDKSRERAEKLKAAHDKDRALLMNYYGKVLAQRDKLSAKEQTDLYNQERMELWKDQEERRRAQLEADISENEWRRKLAEGKLDVQRELAKLKKEYQDKIISIREYEAKTHRLNSIANSNGYTTTKTKTDPVTGLTTQEEINKVPNGQGGGSSSASGGTGKKGYTSEPATKKKGYSFK